MHQKKTFPEWMLAASPLAQLVIDPRADKVLYRNPAAVQLFNELEDAHFEVTASHYFRHQFNAWLVFTQEILANGQAWSDDLAVINADSEPLGLEAQGTRLDSTTELFLLTLQNKDTLEWRRQRAEANRHHRSGLLGWQQIEQVFQEIERQNQLILKAAGDGIYGVDAEGNTTFVNPAAERILGWKTEELVGKLAHDIIHHSQVDGSHYPVQACPIYEAFCDGQVHRVDHEVFWHKSGYPVPVEYTSTPIFERGQLVGAVVIFRDIRIRLQTEQQLRSALHQVEELKQRLELENQYLQEEITEEFNHRDIVGRSPAIAHLLKQVELVAPTDANVLVTGESGTGKELIARAIHSSSSRSDRPLIRVNCAAIPQELFESEFFGHVKGAFTGATTDRAGRFELADGGTLFLDEVGEIPLRLQSKLLRVLQDQQFERVGDSKTRKVDVRLIAATNRDLKEQVRQHRFREDLFFRLNVFPIQSVPLRDRVEDLPLLAAHFLSRAMKKFNKTGLKISMKEIQVLEQYPWPGNVRELENLIERQVILAQGPRLCFTELPAANETRPSPQSPGTDLPDTEADLRLLQRQQTIRALKQCQGKIFGADGAAALLGIPATTLASRLKKWSIDRREFQSYHCLEE